MTKKRSSERSPLSVKTTVSIAKRLEVSPGFQAGKENALRSSKRARRSSDNNNDDDKKAAVVKPEKKKRKLNNNEVVNKPQQEPQEQKKRRRLNNNEVVKERQQEPQKKNKNKRKPSTAPGGTPKKWASDSPHNNNMERTRPKKKVVEVKMAEDGTHNPDRLLFHVRNNLPVDKGEYEAEEDYHWLQDLSCRQIDDFVDLNEGEKAFFKLWNTHLHNHPCYGDYMMLTILEMFIDQYGEVIWQRRLYRNFVLHLSNFVDFGILSQSTMFAMVTRIQKIFRVAKSRPPPPANPVLQEEKKQVPTNKIAAVSNDESFILYLSDEEDEKKQSVKKTKEDKAPLLLLQMDTKKKKKVNEMILSRNNRRSFWKGPGRKSEKPEMFPFDQPRQNAKVTFADESKVEWIVDVNTSPKASPNTADIYISAAKQFRLNNPSRRRSKS